MLSTSVPGDARLGRRVDTPQGHVGDRRESDVRRNDDGDIAAGHDQLEDADFLDVEALTDRVTLRTRRGRAHEVVIPVAIAISIAAAIVIGATVVVAAAIVISAVARVVVIAIVVTVITVVVAVPIAIAVALRVDTTDRIEVRRRDVVSGCQARRRGSTSEQYRRRDYRDQRRGYGAALAGPA